jgi:hypothetical protein
MSLAITRPAGAPMMLAASRCEASTPIPMYAAMTEPAMVAMPPVIAALSSDFVIVGMYFWMTSGASDWPTNTQATADSDSAPEVPIVRTISHATAATMRCITP